MSENKNKFEDLVDSSVNEIEVAALDDWKLVVRKAGGKTSAPPGFIDVVLITPPDEDRWPEGREIAVNGSFIRHYERFDEDSDLHTQTTRANENDEIVKVLKSELRQLKGELKLAQKVTQEAIAFYDAVEGARHFHSETIRKLKHFGGE